MCEGKRKRFRSQEGGGKLVEARKPRVVVWTPDATAVMERKNPQESELKYAATSRDLQIFRWLAGVLASVVAYGGDYSIVQLASSLL